jgi:hypothetical protein
LDATDGLVNAVPVANGGTGASTEAAARTNLNVPTRTGGDASGTWGISISGNAATATSATTASSATFATTAGNGGVTSVNGSTGAVTVSTTPTTAQVLNATAAASAGAVGTYSWLVQASDTTSLISVGTTYSGSSLRYAGSFNNLFSSSTNAPSGTWRAMSEPQQSTGATTTRSALFLRIS